MGTENELEQWRKEFEKSFPHLNFDKDVDGEYGMTVTKRDWDYYRDGRKAEREKAQSEIGELKKRLKFQIEEQDALVDVRTSLRKIVHEENTALELKLKDRDQEISKLKGEIQRVSILYSAANEVGIDLVGKLKERDDILRDAIEVFEPHTAMMMGKYPEKIWLEKTKVLLGDGK